MSGRIIRNIFLLQKRSMLPKKYNLPQISLIRNKQSMIDFKKQNTTEIQDDEDLEKPIKYSTTKAYNMRADEYRLGYFEDIPWYQSHCIFFSITVFLIYFCILREENDIDLLLDYNLEDTLKHAEEQKSTQSSMSK